MDTLDPEMINHLPQAILQELPFQLSALKGSKLLSRSLLADAFLAYIVNPFGQISVWSPWC